MRIHRKRKKPIKTRRRSWQWKLRSLLVVSTLSMTCTTRFHHAVPMDTDSEAIGIDNRASVCISHKIDDFIGELHDSNRVIIGFTGTKTTGLKTGTLRWKWTDDQGISDVHTIPNSIYSPTGGVRLLSPQHWAQSICKNRKAKHPPSCVTTAIEVILQWGDNKYIKTIPLGTRNNVATLYSSPGYDKFQTFCSEAELSNNDTDNVITCEECTSVIEDKDDEPIHAEPTTILHYNKDDHKHFDQSVDDAIMSRMTLQQRLENQSLDLLQLHTKYGHIPFARLREMAKQGIIPAHRAHTKTPVCAACLFGKATRKKWKFKTPKQKGNRIRKVTRPGECISVDMLYSPTPGALCTFIA